MVPFIPDTPTLRVRYDSDCDSDDERLFLCDECPWKFKTKSLLDSHLTNVHSGETTYGCSER